MKLKMTSFIFLIAFVMTTIRCGVDAKDEIPIRPMMPSDERIVGVFQAPSGDIISLNDVGFYMIEAITGRPHSGIYFINEVGLLELHRTDGIIRFQIERENVSRQTARLINSTGIPFHRILSEEQYNKPTFDRLAATYTGIGDEGQGYSLNLNLVRYRIAAITRPDVPHTTFGGYYIHDLDDNNINDDVVVLSNQDTIGFTIQRNLSGEISSLIYRPNRVIRLVREGVHVYTADELTALNNSRVGTTFRINLYIGRSFETIFHFPLQFRFAIEGEPLIINAISQEMRTHLNNHYNLNYHGDYNFRIVLRTGSLTEIICFEAVSPDCPIQSITRLPRTEL